jgi:hypothetical protein
MPLNTYRNCFFITIDGRRLEICYWFPFPYGTSHPKGQGYEDPQFLSISGVAPEVLRELEALSIIHNLSERLSPEIAESLREVVARGMAGVQGKLPKYISLSE